MMKTAKIVLALTFLSFSFTDPPKSVVKGTVTDELGGVIPRARVLLLWDPSGSQVGLKSNVGTSGDLSLITNELGEFETELAPGFYDVVISSAAFSPACQKIRLKQDSPLSIKFKLKADPLVTKELGHQIYAN